MWVHIVFLQTVISCVILSVRTPTVSSFASLFLQFYAGLEFALPSGTRGSLNIANRGYLLHQIANKSDETKTAYDSVPLILLVYIKHKYF